MGYIEPQEVELAADDGNVLERVHLDTVEAVELQASRAPDAPHETVVTGGAVVAPPGSKIEEATADDVVVVTR